MSKLITSLMVSCSLFCLDAQSMPTDSGAGPDDGGPSSLSGKAAAATKHAPIYQNPGMDAPDISSLIYKSTKVGGTGGVHVLSDPTGGLWTLKAWANQAHGVEEFIAGELFDAMGGHVPKSSIYNTLPQKLLAIPELHTGNFYRLSKYIAGAVPTPGQFTSALPPLFARMAFFSFWDLKRQNFVQSQDGKMHWVDSGGSLYHRALGTPRVEDACGWLAGQVTDLQSLRSDAAILGAARAPVVRDSFRSLSNKEVYEQIDDVLRHTDDLMSREVSIFNALGYAGRDKVLYFLKSRLKHYRLLSEVNRGWISSQADPDEETTLRDSAGTLLWAMHNGKPQLLVGQRVRHNWYGNLGGKADPGETFDEAARRETEEESGGSVNPDLTSSPSHDLITIDGDLKTRKFRTYLKQIDDRRSASVLQAAMANIGKYGNPEYTGFSWLAIDEVLKAIEDNQVFQEEGQNTISVRGKILHPPFWHSLRQEPIKRWLKKILRGETIPPTHTQGINDRGQAPRVYALPERFNAEHYILAHRDFAPYVAGKTPEQRRLWAEAHYVKHGRTEGIHQLGNEVVKGRVYALPERFNAEHYILAHRDFAPHVTGKSLEERRRWAEVHYLRRGRMEGTHQLGNEVIRGRVYALPEAFNAEQYILAHPALSAQVAGKSLEKRCQQAEEHWLTIGRRE